MQTLVYDDTFAGVLTAIFDIYEYKYMCADILPVSRRQDSLFGTVHAVSTDEGRALRVWRGLAAKLPAHALTAFYKTWLSEQEGMENMLLQYTRHAFAHAQSIAQDHTHTAVRYINDTAKKVHREKHRMEAFVRFQQTADDIYFSIVEPDFNVLPLIVSHFQKRYADQKWMIYDAKRKYGIYYNLYTVAYVTVTFGDGKTDTGMPVLHESEIAYQQLWQKYFNSVNIAARKNTKLHIQHMPYRYWKYLTEKQLSTQP